MSSTYTRTDSRTFTRAHAKKISYRVATDLKRMQRLYGKPTDAKIRQYDDELVEFLTAGFLEKVSYGYRRGQDWIEPSLHYTAFELANRDAGDDPGRIRAGARITGASFYSFLIYSSAWNALAATEQAVFQERLPFQRGEAREPGVDGYLQEDLAYSAGGRGLRRASVRSWG
jgi:hypothetical protein